MKAYFTRKPVYGCSHQHYSQWLQTGNNPNIFRWQMDKPSRPYHGVLHSNEKEGTTDRATTQMRPQCIMLTESPVPKVHTLYDSIPMAF